MTKQYNDFLTEQATHAQAQILYWTAQALHALKRGYYKNTLNGLQNAIINDILTIYANHVAGGGTSWSELVYLQSQQDFILKTPVLATNAGLCEFAGIDEETYNKNLFRFL